MATHTAFPRECRSVARHGEAGRGEAGQGMARLGTAWLGGARHGKHTASYGVPQFAGKTNNRNKMENIIENEMEVLRLPLWKNCYEEILREGIDYGRTYDAEFFESRLKEKRDSMRFSLDISKIRTALLSHGFFLSGRGQKGEQFVILDASANTSVMENFQSQAIKALRSGVILGTNTRVDVLTDEKRRKHESTLERLAIRSALLCRKIPTLKKAMAEIEK